ncbi:multiple inositol polyphosphate phosphatase 1-like [Synchiropus splendidus]|uniref:multiple inositol polyphosphate phosphatase 1-like n=1 Tax=Synchiropus splendidus TaxID=270530 RepID=UPI00237E79E9|nr:multiple inositol polyphosphate phosphatase 1-like [Synchiropus splendidus]
MLSFPSKLFHFLFGTCWLLCSVNPEETPIIAGHLNTKRRYEDVNLHLIQDILAVNRSALPLASETCQEIHLTAIIRHGTRYPTTKDVRKMQRIYDQVKSSVPSEECWLREIQTEWKMWYTEDMDGRLVQKGVEDNKHLAVRLSKWFPTLLTEKNLHAGLIKFITSSKHRCINSTLSLQAGLIELWDLKDRELGYTVNDGLMRFFDKCPKFRQQVLNNQSAIAEVDKFKHGPEMRRVREKIAGLLGIPSHNISYDMADAAFSLCAYELAIKGLNSPWCKLFDSSDAQVMEYAIDLQEYWKRSYGFDINSKSSCILFHDMFNRLSDAATKNLSGQPLTAVVTIQVGHADTLLPLLTLLGFFKDQEALTSANYFHHSQRNFRTSIFLPYAANFLIVLYKCADGNIRLQALLNEKPVNLPGLSGPHASMPLLQDVMDLYRELLQTCDFEKECQLTS